jgi:hypothetical protein
VHVHAEGRAAGKPIFELVQFLDLDQESGRAFIASENTFLRTIERSGFTFLQPY